MTGRRRPRSVGLRPRSVGRGLVATLLALGGLVAVGLAALVIRPFEAATIDPDAAASVLYFERIVAGTRLEAFVPTTPKPLLTLVFGLTWAAAHDWRVLVWQTLALFGLVVGLAGWWSARLGAVAGGSSVAGVRPWAGRTSVGGRRRMVAAVAAAAFVMTGLAISPDLLLEVSRANSLIWALAGWLVAGLAMTSRRQRPGLAGVALLVAGLARFETLAIVGLAAAALVGRAALAAAGRGRPPAGRTWLVLGGALALPIACLHDTLLTGDPFFWLGVPARYTALYVPGLRPMGLGDFARLLVDRYAAAWPIVALAAVGGAVLVLRRSWVAVVGYAGLGGGVVAMLAILAVRGTYISARYYEPLDLVFLGLAGVGVGGLVGVALGRLASSRRRRPGWTTLAGVAALGVVVALVVAGPPAFLGPRVGRELDLVRTASANLATYNGRLATLAGGPARAVSPGPIGAPDVDPARVALFVPSLLRPRIAVESGAPLTRLGDTYAEFVADPPWPGLHAGQHLYHDRAADRPDALDRVLEADPASLGGAIARPVLVDGAAGVRILAVDSP